MKFLLNRTRVTSWLLGGLFLAGTASAPAQGESNEAETPADREALFIEKLLAAGYTEYADLAQTEFAKNFPGEAKRVKLIRAKLLAQQGKYPEVEVLLKELPAKDPVVSAAKINMGRSMYARGRKDEAAKIFEQIFAEFKDAVPESREVLDELGEAGYLYYQMKIDAQDFPAAAKALEHPIRAMTKQMRNIPKESDPDDPAIIEKQEHNAGVKLSIRLLQAKQGFAMVDQARTLAGKKEEQEKILATAEKLAEKLTLGGYDLAFGHAIVIMMQAQQVRGNLAALDKLTDQYKGDLDQMDELLKKQGGSMSESPKAGARFIKGEMYFEKAKKAANTDEAKPSIRVAAGEFANVFVKYEGSVWKDKAASKFEEVKKFAEEKHKIKIELPTGGKNGGRIAESVLGLAGELFSQKKYAEAIKQYLQVLNQYPEFPGSAKHYGNLALALQASGDHLGTLAVAGFIADRLAKDPAALAALQTIGANYFTDKTDKTLRFIPVYEMIARQFPDSPVAPSAFYLVAETLFTSDIKGGRERAIPMFKEIIDRFPGDKVYVKAANRIAFMSYEEKNFEEAGKLFGMLSQNLAEGPDKANATFRYANCLRMTGKPEEAITLLNGLTKTLDPSRKDSPYFTAENKAKSQELLEDTWFTLALGHIKTAEAGGEAGAAAQKAAADTLATFLTSYPQSKKAPDAMFQLGKMQLKLGKVDEAVKVFNDLSSKYPQSEEGKDALYSLAKAAVEVGKPEVAQDAVKKMLAQSGNYSAVQFLKVGQLMVKNKFYAEAEQCMQTVLKHADTKSKPALEQEAMVNLATAYSAQGKNEEAVKIAQETLKKFPASGYLFQLRLVEAEALAQLKRFEEATAALVPVYSDGHKYDKTLPLRADLVAARIEEIRNDASKAAGAYMRIVMLADYKKPDVAPFIKEAAFKGIEQAKKTNPPKWESVREFADFYLEYFPGDEKAPEMRRARADAITNGAPDSK